MKFIFWSKMQFEKWDFRNPLIQGIGGSETAQVELAQRLVKRGHEVKSYAPIPDDCPKDKTGVEWLDYKEADFNEPGFWIGCRTPELVDKLKGKNQKSALQMQDVYYSKLTPKRALKFDYLLPLCPAHVLFTQNKLPEVKDRIIQSSNGIRTDMIEKIEKLGIKRNPYKLMFASSPDRGLLALLRIFKVAKQRITELELHIFYGFNNIDKTTESDDVPLGDEHVTKRQIITEAQQPGVYIRGRMGQIDLYKEWFSSGIWCHPSSVFAETSCITSMDAQACGAIPITAPVWAIADNVKFGYFIQGQPITDPLIRLEYVDTIEKLLQRKDTDILRVDMMKYARERFDWERITDQIEALAK